MQILDVVLHEGWQMKREVGERKSRIWLLGDSAPKNWENLLDTPLDPLHPARHNIWTSVLDVLQERLYREARLRLDTSDLYIRNAVAHAEDKPHEKALAWDTKVQNGIAEYRQLIDGEQPALILAFGQFAFEFARRSLEYHLPGFREHEFNYWGARLLGAEFKVRICNAFASNSTTIIPLLHTSICRRYFLESHKYFCGGLGSNYFNYVGKELAERI